MKPNKIGRFFLIEVIKIHRSPEKSRIQNQTALNRHAPHPALNLRSCGKLASANPALFRNHIPYAVKVQQFSMWQPGRHHNLQQIVRQAAALLRRPKGGTFRVLRAAIDSTAYTAPNPNCCKNGSVFSAARCPSAMASSAR